MVNGEVLQELRQNAERTWDELENSPIPIIYIGTASCGRAAGALETLEAVQQVLNETQTAAEVIQVGCIGPCYLEPLLDIRMPGQPRVSYPKVTLARAQKIIQSVVVERSGSLRGAIAHFGSREFSQDIPHFFDLPMLKSQERVVLKNCGMIDPERFDHYLARGGYRGLEWALSLRPEEVIETVSDAGLRGRGGGGFPTAKKWEVCRNAPGDPKYLICNLDEGDPGAFMNRSLVEGDPHAVLEGMLIAAYAIGATRGYVYIRAEYPLAVKRLRNALNQLRENGLLGANILGTGFSFDVKVKEGAGAYVCGEETALIASIEGRRGSPTTRPPFPAVSGLHGQPTVINNAETLATLPHILANGAQWYRQFGKPGNYGTKIFSLVGKIRHSGLIEVPLGIPLRTIIEEIGGGTPRPFKAIQTGGPSGGCLSAQFLDLPMDYESLAGAGSIMGSGGLIVMDENTCVVDLAHYFLTFAQNESCGKCTPCRLGTYQLLRLLERIKNGEGEMADLELLQSLAHTVQKTSLCGLGQNIPNPVLTTLRYFRPDYETHVRDRYCEAAICTELFRFEIDPELCTGCGRCLVACPVNAISGNKRQPHSLDTDLCIQCRRCFEICTFDAVRVLPVAQPLPEIN